METPDNQTNPSYIPPEAYLYFPQPEDPRKTGAQRAIFDGNTQFQPYEYEMINDFRSYAEKQNYVLKPLWTDNMILRFLYANNFKNSKTLPSIKEHTAWREAKLPVQIDEPLKKILNSNLLYIHGRDQEFRPIVIFNVHQLDPKKVDVDFITKALTYWFEHVINEWMLPGQVENWIFIADVKGMGVSTLLQPNIRNIFGYLQDNYKCRLHKLYILNVTPILYAPWQIIKKFLDEVTVKKVQLCKGQTPVGLLNSVNPEQVEEGYGGTAKKASQYWPPVSPSNRYFVTPKDWDTLVSEDKYVSMYRSGSLSNMKIDHVRIQRSLTVPIEETDISNQISPAEYPVSSHLTPDPFPVLENTPIGDDYSMSADYLDYMNEMTEHNQLEIVTREFQSSFLANNYAQ